jgi:hypothetical protein
MTPEALQLVQPDRSLRDAFLEMAHDYSAAGEPRYALALRDFDAYLTKLREAAAPQHAALDRGPDANVLARSAESPRC